MSVTARILGNSAFFRFVLTGGVAAVVNIVSRYVLSHAMRFEIAVVVAYLIGMTTAYVLAKAFVFPRSGMRARDEYVRFTIVNIVALVQVWLVSVGLAHWFLPLIGWHYHPQLVAHVVGVLSPVITSYYGHKLFTFRRHEKT